LLAPVSSERYKNGACWAAANGWVISALARENPALAMRMFSDLVEDFRTNGICECINQDYRQLPSYVVSATNPLAGARHLRFR